MSNLTDIIITCGPADDESLSWLQRALKASDIALRKSRKPFLMLTGTKNYLRLDALEATIQGTLWYSPLDVQLFVRGEHTNTFSERVLSCRGKIEYFSVQDDADEWKMQRRATLIKVAHEPLEVEENEHRA